MMSRKRVAAARALAILCTPGNIWRTEVPDTAPTDITRIQIAGEQAFDTPGWHMAGVWEYSAQSLNFGGYSALLALEGGRLRAFSDRGTRFTFSEPDREDPQGELRRVDFQLIGPEFANQLWDIEAATRDPETGQYWLAFESYHAIHRFSVASEIEELRVIDEDFEWYTNAGLESLERLQDGRFLGVSEGRGEALIFPNDPTLGGEPQLIDWHRPAPGYSVTDIAQLPDGRLLLLMRAVDNPLTGNWPPFSTLIAIAPLPDPSGDAAWAPQIALKLDGVVPPENYEGLAQRERPDGGVDVWIIADDNQAMIQRSLLVKLVLDPAALEPAP